MHTPMAISVANAFLVPSATAPATGEPAQLHKVHQHERPMAGTLGQAAGVTAAVGLAAAVGMTGSLMSRRGNPRCAGRLSRRSAEQSQAIPFLPPPNYWKFSKGLPGDAGFDPMDLWKGETWGTFAGVELSMRDAEIKHGRLAMLAAAHWPIAEMYHPQIAAALGMKSRLTESGLNPSLPNGGLTSDPVLSGFLGLAVVVAAITDLSKKKGSEPGDYGLDPLSLKGVAPPLLPGIFGRDPKTWVSEAEVIHGRSAMIAISAFAFQELASRVPVVQETPVFFSPQ